MFRINHEGMVHCIAMKRSQGMVQVLMIQIVYSVDVYPIYNKIHAFMKYILNTLLHGHIFNSMSLPKV